MKPHLVFTCTSSLLALTSLAAHATEQDLFGLSLQELAEVRVTGATLTEKSLNNVPSAVTVFTRDDIRKLPVSTLEELMNLVPGFQTVRSSDINNTSVISVRGRRTAYSSRENLVLLNGMKIDNPFLGGFSTTYANLPLSNIARVEFIRGPGSAIYGSNAFTGVINLITDDNLNQAAASTDGNHRTTASWQHATKPDAETGFKTSALLEGTVDEGQSLPVQDAFNNGTHTTRDGYRKYSAQLQLKYQQNTRAQILLADNQSDNFYTAGSVYDPFNSNELRYGGLLLEQSLHWNPDISSQLQGGLQYWDFLMSLRPFTAIAIGSISDPPSSDPLLFKADIRTQEYWLRWQNDWTLSEHNSLQFGAEYRQPSTYRARAANNYDLDALANNRLPAAYYGDFDHYSALAKLARMNVLGLYAQFQQQWSEKVEGIAGLRFDTYSQVGNSFSPRVGLILHPNPDDTIKLLLGRAFRAPQFDERFTINSPVINGNPALRPETVDTGEVIWLHQWKATQLTLNYFSNQFKNGITQLQEEDLRLFANSNKVDTSNGVEAELTNQISREIKLYVAATHLFHIPDASFRESQQLLSAAGIVTLESWQGSLTFNYQGNKQNLTGSDGTRQTLDSFVVANLKLIYLRADNKLQPYIEAKNLFDKDYVTPSNANNNEGGIPNRRRELRLGFSWDY